MRFSRRITQCLVLFLIHAASVQAREFRVLPYLQNPDQSAMTVRWLSETNTPGMLTVVTPDGPVEFRSQPSRARTLAYNPVRKEPGGPHGDVPWMHSIRVDHLKPGTKYHYSVTQGAETHTAEFRTAPTSDQAVRLIVYSDSETEPESSTLPPVDWPESTGSNRPPGVTQYLADQTAGYRANCQVMLERQPDLILLVGDLVETGGEQRDWDEFWKHNAGEFGSLASHIPIVASLGNHESYAGPGGGHSAAGANFGTGKFRTYFESPDNGASDPKHQGRYFRMDYGPVTILSVDSTDGLPHQTPSDTNFSLVGSDAPDFNPGSEQYRWLEEQLADAQRNSRFTFVQFHHTMFGSGMHSVPFSHQDFAGHSGIAMRVLLPLLMKHGVDAVFSGHDEMLERSVVRGRETLPDGVSRFHSIHCYDVGIGGDGLRGPAVGFDNPYREFLAHENFPEIWDGSTLVSGGKHYGHLEVNVMPDAEGVWRIDIVPVHVFPVIDRDGNIKVWERRLFPDTVIITQP